MDTSAVVRGFCKLCRAEGVVGFTRAFILAGAPRGAPPFLFSSRIDGGDFTSGSGRSD